MTKKILYFAWPVLLIAALFAGKALLDESEKGPYAAGKRVYDTHCANCHMEEGQGLRGLYPPVAHADYVAERGAELACGIINGYAEPLVVNGQTYRQAMPPIEGLSDYEVTQVINYIKTAWGPQGEPVEFENVQNTLTECAEAKQ